MTVLLLLIPAALALGALGLLAFVWSLRADQYEDLDGEAERILIDRPAGLRRQPPDARSTPPR
ncbi:MAG: cbb3-type cytochrome oxidase assembly protein CcoS [Pseudomonadota bacterium]